MKKNFSALCILFVLFSVMTVRAQENKVVIQGKPGVQKVTLDVKIAPGNTATARWGDGKEDVVEGKAYTQTLSHTYENALTDQSPNIELTADHLISLRDSYIDKSVRAVVSIKAPVLEDLRLMSANFYQHADLDLSGCPKLKALQVMNIETIKLPESALLEVVAISAGEGFGADKIEGSRRALKNFPAGNCPALKSLALSSSDIDTLDLSGNAGLENLNLSFSKNLRAILGAKNLTKLTQLNVKYCALSFDMIPDKPASISDISYSYDNQSSYRVPTSRIDGLTIDLSNLYKAKGIEAEDQITTFKWMTPSGYLGKPVPEDKITGIDGVFTFDESLLDDAGMLTVYVVMENAGFPKIGTTYGSEKYKSENIALSKKAVKMCTLTYGVEGTGGKSIAKNKATGETVFTGTSLAEGTEVIITAIPDNGARVKEWKLNGEIIPDSAGLILNHVMAADAVVKVLFEAITHKLTFGAELRQKEDSPSADYAVKAMLDEQELTSPADVPEGKTVKLTAVSKNPYVFTGWLIGASASAADADKLTIEVKVTSDTIIRAQFMNTTNVKPVCNEASLSVYPNPVSAVATIHAGGDLLNCRALLFDANGRLLHRIDLRPITTIDFQQLPAGVYVLRAAEHTVRIIKS